MRKAVIDIGTNSIKFCLAESAENDGSFIVLRDSVSITRLGEGLRESSGISAAALERNARAAADFVNEARAAGAEVKIVGTMALRSAKNAGAFIARVRELTGEELRVITGEEEALLLYTAVIAGIPKAAESDFVAFDAGGGSTEFVYCARGAIKRKFSINIGCVLATDAYFPETPVPAEKLAFARTQIKKELSEAGVAPGAEMLVGLGGNITALAAVKHKMALYDAEVIHGSTLTLCDIRAQMADYAAKTIEERRKIPGLHPQRADVILGGACIVEAAMELCGVRSLIVSDRGMRHGLLYKLFKTRRQDF